MSPGWQVEEILALQSMHLSREKCLNSIITYQQRKKQKLQTILEQDFIILPYTIKLIFYQSRLLTQLAENHRTDHIPKNKYINTHTHSTDFDIDNWINIHFGSNSGSNSKSPSCVILISLQKMRWLLKSPFDQNLEVINHKPNGDFKATSFLEGYKRDF
jgi:hypothetical protein